MEVFTMLVSDANLNELGHLDGKDVLAWLHHHQPDIAQGRTSWWENLITRVLQNMYQAESAGDRHRFARLASLTIKDAVDQGITGSNAGAVRLANLAGFYFAHGGHDDLLFDVDRLVASCLDLIEIPIERAKTQVRHWKTLPISDIRALRDAKNLVTACELIGGRVRNSHTAERLSAWLELRDQLP